MLFADHPPPHFHARYSGDEAPVVIDTGKVFAGSLPNRALRLVRSGSKTTAPSWWQTVSVRAHSNLPSAVAPLR